METETQITLEQIDHVEKTVTRLEEHWKAKCASQSALDALVRELNPDGSISRVLKELYSIVELYRNQQFVRPMLRGETFPDSKQAELGGYRFESERAAIAAQQAEAEAQHARVHDLQKRLKDLGAK